MVSAGDTPLRLVVSPDEAGIRLDAFVTAHITDLSRTRAAWHIMHGHVALSDKRGKLKPGFKLAAGIVVTVTLQAPPVPSALPEDLPLDIVYEDADVLVIAKAAGMVVHPGAGHHDGTLINALLHHDPALAEVGAALRPGLVHRLDKDTSGLLVVARTPSAHALLARQFAEHTVKRRYRAICLGRIRADELTIDTLHGRHGGDRRKFSAKVQNGKRAVTHLEVLARSALATLVDCRLQTGRTHQIRMHLAERGHPIAADELYGGLRTMPRMPRTIADIAALKLLQRQALHAYLLGFVHPTTGETLRFVQPWPDDLAAVAGALFGEIANRF